MDTTHTHPVIDESQQPPCKKMKTAHSPTTSSIMEEDGAAADNNKQVQPDDNVVMQTEDECKSSSPEHECTSSCPLIAATLSESPLPILSPFPGAPDWSYVNKKILAPMVRIGTLPMRKLALELGADIVYSEELVAKKLRTCDRVEVTDERGNKLIHFIPNPVREAELNRAAAMAASGTSAADLPPLRIHNVNAKQFPMLITYPGEPLVVQLGASNADDALAAAKVVEKDCRAIDLNCGCPKHFSLQGGMGAALLSKPDTLSSILRTLRQNINLPITCKIRLLEDEEKTVSLVRIIEKCGVSALAIHARRIEDRPRHRALTELIRPVAAALQNIPLIYNGDAYYSKQFPIIKEQTGAKSVMVARGAMWNPSVFSDPSQPMLSLAEVCKRYMNICQQYDNHFANTKYCVMEMIKNQISSTPLFREITRTRDTAGLQKILDEGLGKEQILNRAGDDYQVIIALEERKAAASTGAAATSGSEVPSNSSEPPSELSRKERRYQVKQNRKNREGRKADAEAAAAAAAAARQQPQSATPAASSSSSSAPVNIASSSSSSSSAVIPSDPSSTSSSSSSFAAASSSIPSVTSASNQWLSFTDGAPIPTWLETDLEPDDLLALYMLFRSGRFDVRTIVVGEGTRPAMKMKRMRAYLALLRKEGILSSQQVAQIRVIPALPSRKKFNQEGCEFNILNENYDASSSFPNGDERPRSALLDMFEFMAPPSAQHTLFAYEAALRFHLLSAASQGGLLLLLKPLREISRVWKTLSQEQPNEWSKQRIALYGGFNTRVLLDEYPLVSEDETKPTHAQMNENLKSLFHSVERTLLFETFHAFDGGVSSSEPETTPALFKDFFSAESQSRSEYLRVTHRLIQLWNAKMRSECEEFVAKIEASTAAGEQVAPFAKAKLSRSRRILSSLEACGEQVVCADQGLLLNLLYADSVFHSHIRPVDLEFDEIGQSIIRHCSSSQTANSNVFSVTGLTLSEMDKLQQQARLKLQ